MPLYLFECMNGHRIETFYKIADRPTSMTCTECGATSTQVPCIGGVEGDSPTWLNDEVRGALQDTDRVAKRLEPPIATRKEWKDRMAQLGVVCVG